jgi:hypothetical protein
MKQGTKHQITIHDTPQQNDVAEQQQYVSAENPLMV